MPRLLTTRDIMERYQCSENTARRYMRAMVHMEKPLRVSETALASWEANRTMNPQSGSKVTKNRKTRFPVAPPTTGGHLISRVRPPEMRKARQGG